MDADTSKYVKEMQLKAQGKALLLNPDDMINTGKIRVLLLLE